MFAKVAPHRGETSHNFTDVQILAATVAGVTLKLHHSQNRIVEEESAERFGTVGMSVTIFGSFSRLHVFLQTC